MSTAFTGPRPRFKTGAALSRARTDLQRYYRTFYEPRFQLCTIGLHRPDPVTGVLWNDGALDAWVRTGAHHERI